MFNYYKIGIKNGMREDAKGRRCAQNRICGVGCLESNNFTLMYKSHYKSYNIVMLFMVFLLVSQNFINIISNLYNNFKFGISFANCSVTVSTFTT